MSVITANRAGPIDKTVLLFSGGLDSVCISHLHRPDILLIIPSSSSYADNERRCLVDLRAAGFFAGTTTITVPDVLSLKHWERDDLIVPNRNAHLVLIASNYADRIWLGSVLGDRSRDKDTEFYRHMTNLLNHTWSEQHWTEPRHFIVDAPAKNQTKTELVASYLDHDGSEARLLESWSCYTPSTVQQHCGWCKPCFRKRVALVNNHVDPGANYWANDFRDANWWPEISRLVERGEYRGPEDQEVLVALDRMR